MYAMFELAKECTVDLAKRRVTIDRLHESLDKIQKGAVSPLDLQEMYDRKKLEQPRTSMSMEIINHRAPQVENIGIPNLPAPQPQANVLPDLGNILIHQSNYF